MKIWDSLFGGMSSLNDTPVRYRESTLLRDVEPVVALLIHFRFSLGERELHPIFDLEWLRKSSSHSGRLEDQQYNR